MSSVEVGPASSDAPESGINRAATVVVLIGGAAAVVAGATIWLLLTDPIAVASALDGGDITPLVRQLATALYEALAGLLGFL